MAGRGLRGWARRLLRTPRAALIVLVVVVLAAASVVVLVMVGRPGSPSAAPSPGTNPSPSVSVSQSPSPGAVLPAAGSSARPPTAAGLRRQLTAPLGQAPLGGRVGWAVADATTGRLLAGDRATTSYTPASVTKLTTALAVLSGPGGAHRIATRVVAGRRPGEVVLIGGGDPTLSAGPTQAYPGAARLSSLARQVRSALGGRVVATVVVDGSAFSGSTLGPGWDTGLVQFGDAAPITAVMVDGGRPDPRLSARSHTPDLLAGHDLAALLGSPGATVVRGTAAAKARQLAVVHSEPLSQMIEQCLLPSDNVLAESLARQVAIWAGQPASFAGAARSVRARLLALGLPALQDGLVDGSGLSRRDRLTPNLLVRVLSVATSGAHPALHAMLAGLPVAGFTGTLGGRYRGPGSRAAAGQVRAKTGSLSGVSTLSGLVTDASGRLLAFAFLANRVPPGGTYAAEQALDRVVTGLSRCGCR